MIEFARPWLLLGLAAALAPLWLHLRGRSRARQVAMSALSFLHRRHPEQARHQRLRERALVAARAVLVALVAVALAGPMLPSCDAPTMALGDEPIAVVVLLDDSLSMQARRGPTAPSRFAVAQERVRGLLATLPPGSEAQIVLTALPARPLLPRLEGHPRALLTELAALQPRHSGDDVRRAAAIAARLLARATAPQRRVVLVSDMQTPGWTAQTLAPLEGAGILVERVGAPLENTAIVQAVAHAAPERGAHAARVEVTLSHVGSGPFEGTLTVQVGGRQVRQTVTLPAGTQRRFDVSVVATADHFEVALPGGDDLAEDDRRLGSVGGPAAVRLLVVDGAPRATTREAESHYLRRAIEAASGGAVTVQVVATDQANDAHWAAADAVWLANVGELAPAAWESLQQRMDAGLGVIASVGDESAAAATLGWLASLLPDTLLPPGPNAAGPGLRLAPPVAMADPAVRAFAAALAPLGPALQEVRLRQRLGVQPLPELDRQVLLRAADGVPALLGWQRGRGRLLLWTSSIDLDWTDLPLQPVFVPLVDALVRAAAGAAPSASRAPTVPGAALLWPRSEDAVAAEVAELGPGATARPMSLAPGGERWRGDGLPRPGRYEVRQRRASGQVATQTLTVVPDAAESSAATWQGPSPPEAAPATSTSRRPRVDASQWALAILVGLLAVEAWLLLSPGLAFSLRWPRSGL